MCTIAFAWLVFDEAPLLLAANRDERVGRPSLTPRQLRDSPTMWGGQDQLAGGTWLAVDPTGRLCAVTNRHPGGRLPERDETRSSRGIIPTNVLAGGDDESARQVLASLRAEDYNPVNVLYLSRSSAIWVGIDDAAGVRSATLAPGVHVLTEQDPDDAASAKTVGLREQFQATVAGSPEETVGRWREVLASHEQITEEPQSAACIHEELFGTVSSSLVRFGRDDVWYSHAEGHPCVTPFVDVLPDKASQKRPR